MSYEALVRDKTTNYTHNAGEHSTLEEAQEAADRMAKELGLIRYACEVDFEDRWWARFRNTEWEEQ